MVTQINHMSKKLIAYESDKLSESHSSDVAAIHKCHQCNSMYETGYLSHSLVSYHNL